MSSDRGDQSHGAQEVVWPGRKSEPHSFWAGCRLHSPALCLVAAIARASSSAPQSRKFVSGFLAPWLSSTRWPPDITSARAAENIARLLLHDRHVDAAERKREHRDYEGRFPARAWPRETLAERHRPPRRRGALMCRRKYERAVPGTLIRWIRAAGRRGSVRLFRFVV